MNVHTAVRRLLPELDPDAESLKHRPKATIERSRERSPGALASAPGELIAV